MVRSVVVCLARNAISLSLILRNCAVCFTWWLKILQGRSGAVRSAEPEIKVGFECNGTSSMSIATIPTLHVCVCVQMYRNLLAFALMHAERLHYTCPLFIFFVFRQTTHTTSISIVAPWCERIAEASHQHSQQTIRFSLPIMDSCHAHLLSPCHSYKCVRSVVCEFSSFDFSSTSIYSFWLADDMLLTHWIVKHGARTWLLSRYCRLSDCPTNAIAMPKWYLGWLYDNIIYRGHIVCRLCLLALD